MLNQLATDLLSLDIVWMADVLPYLVVGPLLGSTIGLGLWRQAVVTRVADVRASVFPVAFGVGVGLGLGQVASLQSAGVGAAALPHAGWLAMNTAVAVGGTYAVAGLGELWADVGSRMRRKRTAWTAAISMSGFVFTFVLWVSEKLRQAFYAGGWAMAGRALFNDIDWAIPAVLAAVLAGAVLCVSLAGGRSPVAPTWLLEVDETLPWPGPGRSMLKVTLISAGLAGTAGALTTVGYRLISGTGHHVYIYIAVSVASAGGAALALSALAPRRGPGLALLATPTAAVVAAFGLLIAGAPQGMTPLVWAPVVPITAGMGLLVAMLAAVAACAGIRRSECAPTWSVVAVGGVLAVLLPVGAIAGQTGLTAFADSERVTERIGEGDAYVEVLTYQTAIAPEATTRLTAAMTEVAELSRDVSLSPEERAALLTGGPIADLRTLLDDMRALSFRDPLLVALHEELLTALDLRKQAWQDYAQSLMTDDPTQLTEANQLRAQADDHLAEWRSGRHRLENYNKSLID